MGDVRARITVVNEGDRILCEERKTGHEAIRQVELDALVDTGAVMVLLPQDIVEALGLGKIDRAIVTLANHQKIELDIAGTLSLTVCGRTMKTDCLVGPPSCEPLIGQIVLERLDLVIDPLKRTLTPRPESPYLPSLKLKSLLSFAPVNKTHRRTSIG